MGMKHWKIDGFRWIWYMACHSNVILGRILAFCSTLSGNSLMFVKCPTISILYHATFENFKEPLFNTHAKLPPQKKFQKNLAHRQSEKKRKRLSWLMILWINSDSQVFFQATSRRVTNWILAYVWYLSLSEKIGSD